VKAGSDEYDRSLARLVDLAVDANPVFSSELFHTLTGYTPEEVSYVLKMSDEIDLMDELANSVVFAVLLNLINVPHRQNERIYTETGLAAGQVKTLREEVRKQL